MKFLYMVLVNCKRYFKDIKSIAAMFMLPIIVVFLINSISGPNKSNQTNLNLKVAVINLDKGNLGTKLVERIKTTSVYSNKEKALKDLKNYNLIALYEIPENFTEEINNNRKPSINSYKLEEGNATQIFEIQIEQKINELFKGEILKKNNIIKNESDLKENFVKVQYNMEKKVMPAGDFTPIVLIMFFLISFSSNITADLLNLRKERILERFCSTSNKGYQIIGSIYLSMIIAQIVMYTASFITMKVLFKIQFHNFGILILNIALMSMVSISLAIMVNRIFKEQGIGVVVVNLISLIMFFLYCAGDMAQSSTQISKVFITLSKFTPFYWSLQSIEKSVIYPNVFVLILIALTFFSAGSIKYSNFAKE
ncbi:ABC transporter permease [Clostridium lundense]|uniref:ABC transporter permease n=1 Tax=Clostridium lundense TaxID=319475 RepID=UPI000482174F|nr:ABC transporter permease [Clostridium lundense]